MQSIVNLFGGNFSHNPEEIHEGRLSTGAAHLLSSLCSDLDFRRVTDHHVHIIGRGTGGSGCYVHPGYESLFSLRKYAKASIIQSAAGITSWQNADKQYIHRLGRLTKTFGPSQKIHGRCQILALDKAYTKDGRADNDNTNFYVPNQYVYDVSQRHKDLYIPGMSVNPYRHDALDELEKWSSLGMKVCKIFPVAQGVNLGDSVCKPFFKKCADLGVTLLVQTGSAVAIDHGLHPELGNPLLLRLALKSGCTVVASHCGIGGTFQDLDSPYDLRSAGLDLFLRLLDESDEYKGSLWGDTAGLLLLNQLGLTTPKLIAKTKIHDKLVYGSDYPLPAVNAVMSTSVLFAAGWITAKERNQLNEIYYYHPMLFNYATNRLIRGDDDARFSSTVFTNTYL